MFSLLAYFWWYKHKQLKAKSQLNTEILLNPFSRQPAVGVVIVKQQVSILD